MKDIIEMYFNLSEGKFVIVTIVLIFMGYFLYKTIVGISKSFRKGKVVNVTNYYEHESTDDEEDNE